MQIDMKKAILATIMMVMALSVFAQTQPRAYIYDDDESGITNVCNAPDGTVVQRLPNDYEGGFVVTLLEVKDKWWRIDPKVDIYTSDAELADDMLLDGSETGYWVHYSVLAFGISGEKQKVVRAEPSMKAMPLKVEGSYWDKNALRPLEVKGDWIKVVTTDKRYKGWMPIDKICYNPIINCP